MAVVKRLERESGDVYNRPTVGEFMCEMSMDQKKRENSQEPTEPTIDSLISLETPWC